MKLAHAHEAAVTPAPRMSYSTPSTNPEREEDLPTYHARDLLEEAEIGIFGAIPLVGALSIVGYGFSSTLLKPEESALQMKVRLALAAAGTGHVTGLLVALQGSHPLLSLPAFGLSGICVGVAGWLLHQSPTWREAQNED